VSNAKAAQLRAASRWEIPVDSCRFDQGRTNMLKGVRLVVILAACVSIAPKSYSQAFGLTLPTVLEISSPLVFDTLPRGSVVDLSRYYIKAIAPMYSMVFIQAPSATPSNPGPQNMNITVKLGILDANNLADHAMIVSETTDSIIEVVLATNGKQNCVWLNGGNFMTANNLIRIGAITNCGGNGLLLQTLSNSNTYNVQGNHIEVGQIINMPQGSGVVAWTGAVANTFRVGPVEHNGVYGCFDGSGGNGPYANRWFVNGVNSNGIVGAC
jgi:hypothetical protein